MRFVNLSGHPDIGSNSYLLEFGSTRVVLDAGTHPKHTGRDTLPRYELLESNSIDGIFLSHPHLDHIGALPVLMRDHPDAAVVMTEISRHYGDALLHNSVNVMKAQREELGEPLYPLYSHGQVEAAVRRWKTREVGEPFQIGHQDRLECEFFRAGHVLGAVGIRIRHAGHTLFYTGDVHFEDQTLTRAAEFPREPVDTLVMETTRGDHSRDSSYHRRAEKERFGLAIRETLARGGSVMIPVFAFGKTQELLLLLKELFEEGMVPEVPVHIGGLSTKLTEVTDLFSDHPDRYHRGYRILEDFPSLRRLPRGQREPEFRPGAIYALSSGMMTEHTVSYRFARRVLSSEQSSLFLVGYADEDSPAGRIMAAGSGGRVSLSDGSDHETLIRCQLDRFDFSGHATREQLVEFATSCRPRTVILVHGDEAARGWFQKTLAERLPEARILIPRPGESIPL